MPGHMAGTSLSGRAAAVTGGARGIGRAIATSLARRGAGVAVGDLDGEAAERAAGEIGGGAIGLAVDVTDPDSFESFLDGAREAHGPLDVLVNNAGVMVVGPLVDANPAAAARVMDVNVDGVINGMRLAIPRLRGRGGGQIVNVVSGAGWVAPAALATYAASKHAAKALSDSVRDELRGEGIRVTAVYPMLVQTDLAVGTKPARGGRWISPEEVGEAVAAAVEKPRDEVFVPRWVAGVLRVQAALPPRGRDAMARAFGVDKLYTSVDPKTRAEYERRLGGG
jgi:NAD(P)-dependent dehydrogenase (short-subunit alcohol dehydrogenase family)